MKRSLKKICGFLIVAVMVFGVNMNVRAEGIDKNVIGTRVENNDVQNKLEDLLTMFSDIEDFENWTNCNLVKADSLYDMSHNENASLFYVYDNGNYDGYMITDLYGTQVYEFSHEKDPYAIALSKLDSEEYIFIYENASYYLFGSEKVYGLNEFGDMTLLQDTSNEGDIALYTLVPGTINPGLQQNEDNCIVVAVANCIWYYGNNYCPVLLINRSFSGLKSEVCAAFVSRGGFANAYIPSVMASVTGDRFGSAVNVWNPSFSALQTEINAGRPCLLGFAAGSIYSAYEGHMTLCVGYTGDYAILCDGHSAAKVYKRWSTYNDFICKISLVY